MIKFKIYHTIYGRRSSWVEDIYGSDIYLSYEKALEAKDNFIKQDEDYFYDILCKEFEGELNDE
ncbi:MAG: hypothetical protein ACRCX2_10870 [Paraclostridium sp.]